MAKISPRALHSLSVKRVTRSRAPRYDRERLFERLVGELEYQTWWWPKRLQNKQTSPCTATMNRLRSSRSDEEIEMLIRMGLLKGARRPPSEPMNAARKSKYGRCSRPWISLGEIRSFLEKVRTQWRPHSIFSARQTLSRLRAEGWTDNEIRMILIERFFRRRV